MAENLMDKLVSLSKRRGFIFQSSEIYGGLGSVWDYGPLGAELKRQVKNAWWKANIQERDDMVGLDAAILMDPKVWQASGHTDNFADILVDCKTCKKRFRQDHIKGKCPECGGKDFTEGRAFNLMLKTFLGPVEGVNAISYLRPETAQGIFINFANVVDTSRKKLPFGIAQIGKSFRNEITPGNFIFRTREFEQMEIEYFVAPSQAEEKYKEWIDSRYNWYLKLGIKKENLKIRPHAENELAHYAKACSDIEYNFPFGWSELEGIANRTDFDLRQHAKLSGQKLTHPDLKENDGVPYIIEPSGGVDRAMLAFMADAYHEEKVREETRVVLKFHKDLAPTQVAILPLLKNREEIVALAKKIAVDLRPHLRVAYDDTAAIGKLYRRQDEVGTLYCVTIDVQSLEDKQVTVRDRDTMKQDRITIEKLKEYLFEKLN
ncbi:MAG: glycine--tRNA ligase [Candidatus Omnitrophota bacterium]|nr:glycine--tRNA ligase [Candidatus Omnitrophota bacterium]